jgi:hypothetical protein
MIREYKMKGKLSTVDLLIEVTCLVKKIATSKAADLS